MPLAKHDGPLFFSAFFMAVRPAAATPSQFARSVTRALHGLNSDLRVTPRPAADQVRALLAQDTLVAQLAAFTGAQALLLAAIGLFGVTAYTVHLRRLELGIRIALGGTAATVIRLILSRVATLVCTGVGIGCGLAFLVSPSLAPLLYGLRPHDPLTYLGAAVGVVAAGLLAGAVPAARASRIDPAQCLRT